MVTDTISQSSFDRNWLTLIARIWTRPVLGALHTTSILLTTTGRQLWRLSDPRTPLLKISSGVDRSFGPDTRSRTSSRRLALLRVPNSATSTLVALAVLTVTGCADLVSPISPDGAHITEVDTGELERSSQPSLPSTSSCFVSSLSDLPYDTDRDGLFDSCEYQLAQRFRPRLTINDDDLSSLARNRHTLWAAAPSNRWTPHTVTIFYALGYYEDLGDGVGTNNYTAHQGDSEYIVVNLINSGAHGWRVLSTCGSNHGSLVCQGDNIWWVAERKHANYVSQQSCNGGGLLGSDNCANNDAQSVVSVRSGANLGSAHRPLVNCVSAPAQWRTGTECLWGMLPFCGWTTRTGASCSTAYRSHLGRDLPNVGWTQPPVAAFTVTCSGTNCTLNASGSSDDMRIVRYQWHIQVLEEGRTTRSSQQEIIWTDTNPIRRHNFVGVRRFRVNLTVFDDFTGQSSRTVTVFLT